MDQPEDNHQQQQATEETSLLPTGMEVQPSDSGAIDEMANESYNQRRPDVATLTVRQILPQFGAHRSLAQRELRDHLKTLDDVALESSITAEDGPAGTRSTSLGPPRVDMSELISRLRLTRNLAIKDLIQMEKVFLHAQHLYNTRPSTPSPSLAAAMWWVF